MRPGAAAHVLLITFDTTRADYVGFASGREGLTPMLDAMAERGVWFPTCLTPQPLTLPSHTSIMTGLYPFSHGVTYNLADVTQRSPLTRRRKGPPGGGEGSGAQGASVIKTSIEIRDGGT